jgi:hypothetical protein
MTFAAPCAINSLSSPTHWYECPSQPASRVPGRQPIQQRPWLDGLAMAMAMDTTSDDFQQHDSAGMCAPDSCSCPFLLYISCRVCGASLAILWPGRRVFTVHHCSSSAILSVLIPVTGFIVTTNAACGELNRTSRKWTVPVGGVDDPTAFPCQTSRDALEPVLKQGRSGPRGGAFLRILERSHSVESKRLRQLMRPFRVPGRQSARNRTCQATRLLPMRLPLSTITKRIIPGGRD